ncbi:MAG: hypothetical protein AAGA46_00565 [Cyanobacteria bacterium P01_F01_bin.13]
MIEEDKSREISQINKQLLSLESSVRTTDSEIKDINRKHARETKNLEASLRGAESEVKDLKKICAALLDRVEKTEELLAGDETGNFGFIQIRSLIRGLQGNTRFLQRALSLVGVGGAIGIVSAFTGWGSNAEQEFVHFESYEHLEERVLLLEFTNKEWTKTIESVDQHIRFVEPE